MNLETITIIGDRFKCECCGKSGDWYACFEHCDTNLHKRRKPEYHVTEKMKEDFAALVRDYRAEAQKRAQQSAASSAREQSSLEADEAQRISWKDGKLCCTELGNDFNMGKSWMQVGNYTVDVVTDEMEGGWPTMTVKTMIHGRPMMAMGRASNQKSRMRAAQYALGLTLLLEKAIGLEWERYFPTGWKSLMEDARRAKP